ncbi:MAG: DUF1080 domain-containing protein [Verrucomicrobia bacterium]|nr:DUF1080 domain-containing protein [Verrucomicrobiota bacterium]
MHATRPILGLALLAVTLTVGCHHPGTPAGSHALFNGRNLNGWVVMHGGEWTVSEGVLTGRNGVDWTTNPEKSGSWLRTAVEYTDFILELEYAINTKGNSGIFLRSGLERNPAFTGNEMQILDDHGMAEPKTWSTGALYDVVAANRVASRPAGEWNQVRIEARGPQGVIWLNGSEILRHGGLRAARGYLGLQNHDDKSVVQFRNIRITELTR